MMLFSFSKINKKQFYLRCGFSKLQPAGLDSLCNQFIDEQNTIIRIALTEQAVKSEISFDSTDSLYIFGFQYLKRHEVKII